MDVCEWLNSYKFLEELIDAKKEERARLFAIATDTSPGLPDGMPHDNTGMVSQKVQNAICDMVDLEMQELDKLIAEYIDIKKKIVFALEKLPAKEYAVLHRYYIRHMTIEEIAEVMDKSTVTIWRIKKKGLNNLKNVIECNG